MRFGKGTVTAIAFAAAISGGSSLALGSTFLKVDIPTLRAMSEAVVKAHVVDVRSSWNDEGTAIFTYVTLEVKGRLSGRTDNQLIVRVPGGTVGNFTSVMQDGIGNAILHGGLANGMPISELSKQLGRSGR
jgi:hypothetical protein